MTKVLTLADSEADLAGTARPVVQSMSEELADKCLTCGADGDALHCWNMAVDAATELRRLSAVEKDHELIRKAYGLLYVERDALLAENAKLSDLWSDMKQKRDALLDVLIAIKERLDTSHLHVLSGHEVFDSFYIDLIDAAIKGGEA